MEKKYTLMYEEELLPFMEVIDAAYIQTTSSDIVFRSTLTDPPTIIDSTPQSKRGDEERMEEEKMIFTSEEVSLLTDEEKKSYVGERAISVFKSREKCLKDIKNIVNRIAENYSLEEAEAYLNEKRGPFIVKLKFSDKVGLIQRKFNKKGHKNVLLNEGESIDSYIVETYPSVDIVALLEEDKLDKYRTIKESGDHDNGNHPEE